jgi:hypothetical protein
LDADFDDAVTLYRPTGEKELALVRDSGWRKFPPRLPNQSGARLSTITARIVLAAARTLNIGYRLKIWKNSTAISLDR